MGDCLLKRMWVFSTQAVSVAAASLSASMSVDLKDVMMVFATVAMTAGLLVVLRVVNWGGLLVFLRVFQMSVGWDAPLDGLLAVLKADSLVAR
jgi:hypothetical protein